MLENSWAPFRKASDSGESNCVEVSLSSVGGARIRDSKDADGPVLEFTPSEWDAFRAGVLNGEFAA